MRFLSLPVSVVAGFGLLAASSVSTPTNANQPPHGFGVRVQRARPVTPGHPRTMLRRGDASSASGCSSETGNGAFVGAGYNSIAGNYYSGVLTGVADEACGEGSAVIAGGSLANTHLYKVAGGSNEVDAYDSMVGAGDLNWVSESGSGSFIAAGGYNHANTEGDQATYTNIVSGQDAFVGAGDANQISGNGSFIGAGGFNSSLATPSNQISGTDSFIGAGDQNTVAGQESVVGGGQSNAIASGGTEAVIAGGIGNIVTGQKSAIGGGEYNETEGSFSTVPGGYRNLAVGNESFAAGSQADAKFTGSFVWSDYASGEVQLNDGAADQFVVRASGGVYIYSNAKSPYNGVRLAAGSGTWASVSDRNAKTDIAPLDDASVLAKVSALPVDTWRYKTESGVRHVGPMAQDFYAAFGVGEDDRHITSIDEDGIALAAIKALSTKLAAQNAANARLQSRLAALEAQMAKIVNASSQTRR